MSSSLRRGALTATVALTIAPLVVACGAGFDAETGHVQPINASAEVEDIQIQNVNVVVGDDGAAAVSGRLFNSGAEDLELLAITLPDSGAEVALVPAGDDTSVVVPAGGVVGLGGEGNPAGFIADAEEAGITLGNAQHLVFDLAFAGNASVFATVVPATGQDGAFAYYENWGPTAPPEPALPAEDEEELPDGPTDPADDAADEVETEAPDSEADTDSVGDADDDAADDGTGTQD